MTPGNISRRTFLAGIGAGVGLSALAACSASAQQGSPTIGSASRSSPSDAGSAATKTPSADRRWPGEWERHRATLMSMPFQATIYGRHLPSVQREWAGVARAIARFEPVKVIIPIGSTSAMRSLIGGNVELMEFRYDDGWLRDNGPVFVKEPDGSLTGLDWGFNGWGEAFDKWGQTWHKDDRLPTPLLRRLGIPREAAPMILEGGSVQADGNDTILTTEECLLNPNRNPSMDKAQIEAMLLERFGARKVIWLPYGLLGDLTSGHVDGVAMWIGPGRVLAQTDPDNAAEQERLAQNLDVLRSSTDADGNPLEVIEFPFLPRGSFAGLAKVSFTYLNFGFANGGLVVPVTGDGKPDRRGLGMLREIITDRSVVGVPAATINWAGGGVHCITQQLPAA